MRVWTAGVAKFAACVASCVLFFVWLPSPIDAMKWEVGPALQLPVAAPMGVLEEVTAAVKGPESIAFDTGGDRWAGLEGGIVESDYRRVNVGGRPLGLAWHPALGLLVANTPMGLQRIAGGEVETLATEADGKRIEFANGIAVAFSGEVYLTDSNDKFNAAHGYTPPLGAYDMLEMRPRGRLLRYDPTTRETTVVLRELHFPNGLALSLDGATLYVAETFRCRVLKVDLPTGVVEVFVEGLPGYPDNLAVDWDPGHVWVAIGVRRTGLHDWVQGWPWLRDQVAKLPTRVWRRPVAQGLVIAFDSRGQVQHALEDAVGELGIVTSAVPRGRSLYLGSLSDVPVVRVEMPK